MAGRSTGRRVTMGEAAEVLGVSVEAIRKRVQRDTIRSDKGPDGRRYVYLDESHPGSEDEGSRALVDEMRGRIEDLRDQLAAERRANEENRRIIAALTQRIPEIEAPRESDLNAEDVRPAPTPTGARAAPETASQRPWWRRIFE